ncbi:MAG: hypothetical protein P1V21_18030 [Rhizobiaceae bacterium]|nr:hypothetical protein [Rhizobiaceae bacterium]
MTKLLYRLVPHNGGAVFAEESRAMHIVQINRALDKSKTWGDFKSAMPSDEYLRIIEFVDFEDEDQSEPDPNEQFDGCWLTEEGDYPDWLQLEMDNVIPGDILERYGKPADTFLNGTYWHIALENMEPMAEALRLDGYIVEAAQDLPFH